MEFTAGSIINLTPHDVVIYEDGVLMLTIAKSGTVARLTETVRYLDGKLSADSPYASGWGMTAEVTLGGAEGLPEPARNTTYIVSMPLAMGLKAAGIDRPDVVYPFGQVRDESGRIIGCEKFARIV